MPRFNLPDITFVEKSPEKIETDIINRYSKLTQKSLSRSDPVRKYIQSIAYILSVLRSNIDYSAKQNLLSYGVGSVLDHLGAFYSTKRLEAQQAKTTVRFYFSLSQQNVIPAGTRVTAGDGVFFESIEDVVVSAEQTHADVEMICTEPGEIGNGYLPGQLNQLVDPLPWVQAVENITTSEGGSDEEDDDSYAERIHLAPEGFSVAGPEGAYVYFSRAVSPLIVDVAVESPSPGVVEIRPLLRNGEIPGDELLNEVAEILSSKTIRPLTDHVKVLAPEVVTYDIEVTYWLGSNIAVPISEARNNVEQAVNEYVLWQKTKIGRDIDPSELIARIKNAGAKRVEVRLPEYHRLEKYQVAKENTVTVIYGGVEDE